MLKIHIKIKKSDDCILSSIYQYMLKVCKTEEVSNCWISHIKQWNNNLGFWHIWNCKERFDERMILLEVKKRLTHMFIHKDQSYFKSSSKCIMCKHLFDN